MGSVHCANKFGLRANPWMHEIHSHNLIVYICDILMASFTE